MKRILIVAALTTLLIGNLSFAPTLLADEAAGKNNPPMASGMMSQEGMKGMMGQGGGGMMDQGEMMQGGMMNMMGQMGQMMATCNQMMQAMIQNQQEEPHKPGQSR